MSFNDIMTQVAKFNTLASAESYKYREAGLWIVLGDNGEYWVAMRRYAAKLVKLGYTMVED